MPQRQVENPDKDEQKNLMRQTGVDLIEKYFQVNAGPQDRNVKMFGLLGSKNKARTEEGGKALL